MSTPASAEVLSFPGRWIMAIAETRLNYWATYVVDATLLIFFLHWDIERIHASPAILLFFFGVGIFSWSLTEYIFHRWIYHGDQFALTRKGHDMHHADPHASVAMPFFVTPILFLLPQQLLAQFWNVPGLASGMAGWLLGFIIYGFFHHSLHHHSLPFRWYKRLRGYHRVHHATENRNYGVTSPCWDDFFNTRWDVHALHQPASFHQPPGKIKHQRTQNK